MQTDGAIIFSNGVGRKINLYMEFQTSSATGGSLNLLFIYLFHVLGLFGYVFRRGQINPMKLYKLL